MLKSIYPKFKVFIFPFLLFVGCLLFMFALRASDSMAGKKPVTAIAAHYSDSSMEAADNEFYSPYAALYEQINLDKLGLSQEAFTYALQGYSDLAANGAIKNNHILSIADFSLPSYKKRFFVIDLLNGKVLFNTLVSHGRNSGKDMATEFSNELNSFKSSLGFYVTANTYKGAHGYSLRLQGKEEGINDNAWQRSIVMHAADYVTEGIIKVKGYIGRSHGCPALPPAVHKAIINTIKGGSCLFVYSPDQDYISNSKFISQSVMKQQNDSTVS